MTIDTIKKDGTVTLKIAGRLDTMTAPALETAINELDNSVKDLVLDMSEVEYISSAGLRVLLSAQKKMNQLLRLMLILKN